MLDVLTSFITGHSCTP